MNIAIKILEEILEEQKLLFKSCITREWERKFSWGCQAIETAIKKIQEYDLNNKCMQEAIDKFNEIIETSNQDDQFPTYWMVVNKELMNELKEILLRC